MKTAPLILAALLLASCSGWRADGGLRLPRSADEPCAHPTAILRAYGEDALSNVVTRLGDELLVCEAKRAAAVQGLVEVRGALGR